MQKVHLGNKVISTKWGIQGKIVGKDSDSIYVHWDNTSVEDQIYGEEIRTIFPIPSNEARAFLYRLHNNGCKWTRIDSRHDEILGELKEANYIDYTYDGRGKLTHVLFRDEAAQYLNTIKEPVEGMAVEEVKQCKKYLKLNKEIFQNSWQSLESRL